MKRRVVLFAGECADVFSIIFGGVDLKNRENLIYFLFTKVSNVIGETILW